MWNLQHAPYCHSVTATCCAAQDGNDQAPDVSRLMSAEEFGCGRFEPVVACTMYMVCCIYNTYIYICIHTYIYIYIYNIHV